MAKTVKYADVQKKLVSLGFRPSTVRGSHRVFRHPANKAVVVLPFRSLGSAVDRTHLAAVRSALVAADVVSPDAFTESFFEPPPRKARGHSPSRARRNGRIGVR